MTKIGKEEQERSMRKGKKIKIFGLLLTMIIAVGVFFGLSVIKAEAAALYVPTDTSSLKSNMNLGFIKWTDDHYGWTVDQPLPAGEGREVFAEGGSYTNWIWAEHSYWYEDGYTVNTGVPYNYAVAGTGQHVYSYSRSGLVPIAQWEVFHTTGKCIHGAVEEVWHGIPRGSICGLAYWSGWNGYCADCGHRFYGLMYMSKENISQIQAIDTDYDYFYQCPGPDRTLEQTYGVEDHYCNSVSWNQYRVKYDPNDDSLPAVLGEVNETYHMYNNEAIYRGQYASGCTDRLSDNQYGFETKGYVVTGWSTTPGDPFGIPEYSLGQKITTNLSQDDWKIGEKEGTGKGTVTLYARWKKVEGSLIVSPGSSSDIANGAVYNDGNTAANRFFNNSTKSTTIKGVYTNSYIVDTSKLTAPKMGTVSFNTQGGAYIAPISVYKEFLSWEKSYPFYGRFSDTLNKYVFFSQNDGFVDTLTATWKNNTITLPDASKDGWSFGGWYEDPGCTKPAGGAGEPYTPNGDVTLYAKWSQLVLRSVTDLTVDGGKGGVDLTWSQEDSREKFYKIYQKKEGASSWTQIYSANDVGGNALWSGNKIEKSVAGTYTVTIPASGFYTIEAYGAQGGDHGSYSGGKGGYVSAKVWLVKGDIITYSVADRTSGGNGSSTGAAGGGATVVTSSQHGVLAIAGGGGGASSTRSGGEGGLTSGLVSNSNEGQSGTAGGGDGYRGGRAGVQKVHNHTADCEVTHRHVAGCYTYVPHTHQEGVCPQGEHEEYCGGVWWSDELGDWERGFCPNCGVDETYGCTSETGVCAGGGTYWTCTKTSENVLTCGKNEGDFEKYGCDYRNYESGYIYEDVASYGGSNYINTAKAISYNEDHGVQSGKGFFRITINEVGYLDTLRLDNVPAHDEAKPDSIDMSTVSIEAAEGSTVRVSFYKPEDHGTVYYHYAESYLTSDKTNILSTTISSPTYNNILTGVKRYYYILNTSATTAVTEGNKQGSTNANAINVRVNVSFDQYLHVAAVDAAGNVSDTIHIKIEPREIPWNLGTQQIGVSSIVGGIDYGSVYPSGTNSYYVKADGSTPFDLSFRAYVQGTADADYQVDNEMLEISLSGVGTQKYNTVLPLSSSSVAGAVQLNAREFIRSGGGSSLLMDARYTTASRYNYATVSDFTQAFIGYPAYSGKTLVVVPHAGASYINEDGQNDVKWSDSASDENNKVRLIMDGEGPVVSGTGAISGVTEIDLTNGPIDLDIFASDVLSGLKDIKVTITNPDSGDRRVVSQDPDGHVKIQLNQNEPIFMGSFAIEIVAKDNVGNETVITYNPIYLALQADISKVHEDGLATYAKGEGAYLDITTHGYADKVTIDWPTKILAENPELPTVIDYASRSFYTQMEKISFVVPLTANDGERLEITVKAYKDGVMREEKPYLEVAGNALDDIRYRIK